MQTD
jgi:hypothetical protein